MNLTAIRIRFLIRLLSLPWVWIPLAAAAVLLLSGYDNLLALACYWFVPISLIGTLLIYASKVLELAVDDVRNMEENAHLNELRSLRRRLREDTDHRSSQLIRDLRNAFDRMRQNDLTVVAPNESADITELKMKAQNLYQSCHESLERTYKLWKAGRQMRSKDQTGDLMETRSRLLVEVGQSLLNLEHAIDFLQSNQLKAESDGGIANAREELQYGLDATKRIQERLNQLDRELTIGGTT